MSITSELQLPRTDVVLDGNERKPALWPVRSQPYGPATVRRQWRTRMMYAIVCAFGVLPILLGGPPQLKAFGLGLLFPGAGMFYPGNEAVLVNALWFAATMVLFSIAFVIWFGSGNVLAPLAVWLGAAAFGALRATEPGNDWLVAVPIAGAVTFAVVNWFKALRHLKASQSEIANRNARLAEAVVPARPRFIPEKQFVGEELDQDQLEHLRYGLEGALQPIDSFWGFDRTEQFQLSATRYQINSLAYMLANAHYSRMPAFHGYMAQAQRNLIEKMLVPEVWRYWRTENRWGNLSNNADPVIRDNIMLTGYWGMQIGLYESITGDTRYGKAGALTFEWDKRTRFPHDCHSVNRALYDNYKRSDLGYFPCEPNWVYPACNAHGMLSLILHDRLHGSTYAEEVAEAFRFAHEVEFIAPDGRPVEIKSTRLGWNFTFPAIFNGTLGNLSAKGGGKLPSKITGSGLTGAAPMLAGGILPDLTERDIFFGGYDESRQAILSGKTDLHAMSAQAGAAAYLPSLSAAVEYGDEELTKYIWDAYRTDPSANIVRENGVAHVPNETMGRIGSLWYGMFGRHGSSYDLINRGNLPEWNRGPILEEVPYPHVLVARAVTDGESLNVVLRPGGRGGRYRVTVARLLPGREYTLQGACGTNVVADGEGRAHFDVVLEGRLELTVAPSRRTYP